MLDLFLPINGKLIAECYVAVDSLTVVRLAVHPVGRVESPAWV
jgi:hypothetical protein